MLEGGPLGISITDGATDDLKRVQLFRPIPNFCPFHEYSYFRDVQPTNIAANRNIDLGLYKRLCWMVNLESYLGA